MWNIIKQGQSKKLLCKCGFHKWRRVRRIHIAKSNIVDLERKCIKCNEFQRKTIPRDFEFGFG